MTPHRTAATTRAIAALAGAVLLGVLSSAGTAQAQDAAPGGGAPVISPAPPDLPVLPPAGSAAPEGTTAEPSIAPAGDGAGAAPAAAESPSDASAGVPSPSPDGTAAADDASAVPLEPGSSASRAPADAAAGAPPARPRRDTLPHDLSPWGMFMAADWVVKGVMIGLAFASLVTWTIWLSKALELAFAKRRARAGVRRVERAESLAAAIEASRRWRGPVATLAKAANEERRRSGELSPDGIKERASVALSRIEARAGRSMSRGTGILATIGSTAPFVGLFGTVWGIMNAFIGISEANTTNLAVVAPGIAEALLATAIGLVAAIPAVIVYNVFARSIAGYRAILADGSAAVLQHLSRELDRRHLALGDVRFDRAAE